MRRETNKVKNDRFQQGVKKIKEYTKAEEVDRLLNSDGLKDLAPDLRRYIIEFAYGDIYSRPGLTNQQRALVTIASLVTQGTEPQIKTHIKRATVAGVSPTEIVEAIMQLIPYVGFPRVQNALNILKDCLSEKS